MKLPVPRTYVCIAAAASNHDTDDGDQSFRYRDENYREPPSSLRTSVAHRTSSRMCNP